MLLIDNNVSIWIFDVTNVNFELVGEVNLFQSIIWQSSYDESSTFQIKAPVTAENKDLFKADRIVWCKGDVAAIIEKINVALKEDGNLEYTIKGRTLESLLKLRIMFGNTYTKNDICSTIIYDIVNTQCVNPSDLKRKIPYLECAENDILGHSIAYQKTGGEIYDIVESLVESQELGFKIIFKPDENKMIFKVYKGRDLTKEQEQNSPVVFSSGMEDILSSEYNYDNQNYKNLAYVAGEDAGADRKRIYVGDSLLSGLERHEMYVDAKDLQSEISDSSGGTLTMTSEEYEAVLTQRGKEKISENAVYESFEANVRVVGNPQYVYGIDYEKGDIVTIEDDSIGVSISARIMSVEESYEDKYSLNLTFGYSTPTLMKKIKRKIN